MERAAVLGKRLRVIGVVGLVGAAAVAIGGLVLTSQASTSVSDTIGPLAALSQDVVETIDATGVMVERTTEAVIAIEEATRSSGRTLGNVAAAMAETGELVGGEIADSLDSAVDTLPALISTAAVIDTTMTALSFVGVDYDPDVPLDESLEELEASLRPIPDLIRDQALTLVEISADVDQVVSDSGELAAVLLQTRIDMLAAQDVLESASANAAEAAEQIRTIESDVESYDFVIRVVTVAAALALAAGSLAPLLIGRHLMDSDLTGE